MNWLYKMRVCLISAAAALLIIMAVSFSVVRILLPHATGYVESIQQALTQNLGLPVTIKALDADMNWLTPRLKILDLIVYKKNGKDELIHFQEANFSLAYIESLRNLSPMIGSIDLVGAEIFIERHKDNRWVIQGQEINNGLSGKSTDTKQLIHALENINYSLLGSHIHWRDFTHKTEDMEFKSVDVKIESFLKNHNFDIKVNLPKQFGRTLQVIAELYGDLVNPKKLEGEIYINGTSLIIEKWLSKLKSNTEIEASGLTDVALWVYFGDKKIKRVIGNLSNTDIKASNLKHRNIIWNAEKIDFRFLYRKLSNGWRVDVEDLYVVKNNNQWLHKSKMLIKDATDIEQIVSIDYLRLQDVIPLAYIFSDQLDNEILKPYNLISMAGDVYNLNASISESSKTQNINGTVEDLAFNLKKEKISGDGIDGEITVDGNNVTLSMDANQIHISAPAMFRSSIGLKSVTGDIALTSHSHGFSITSPNISVNNEDLSLRSRIDFKRLNDVSNLDMQVDFFDVNTNALHKYYPINMLSSGLIGWLDTAIKGGNVKSGGFVFRGNTSDFPFANNEGVMEVDFAANNLDLRYLNGWPNLSHLNTDLRFYNSSLSIENGVGQSQNGHVYDVNAIIPDLNNPVLTVSGKAKSDASNIQKFVWNSGLNDLLGAGLNQFSMSGNALLDFAINTKLGGDNKVNVNGKLRFENAQLNYPTLNYLLTDINGSLSFTESQMSAKNIRAKFGNRNVAVNIVPVNTKEKRESVINISGDFKADDLLNSFSWIPESWASGDSHWDAGIHIPYSDEAYLLRVTAQSQLKNVVINAADGIQKKTASLLPVNLDMLVYDEALKMTVDSKDIFHILATRDENNIWQTDIESSLINGTAKFEEGMSTDSTVTMNLKSITLDAFASRKAGDGNNTVLPSDIPSLEIKVEDLKWDDLIFSNVSLSSGWHPQGMLIKAYKFALPSLLVDGQGSWLVSKRMKHESSFKINVYSKNLGDALAAAGIETGLRHSELTSTSDWQWQGEPYAFSWDKVNGETTMKLKDGVMRGIGPGKKGRLLGLFNILELPKRASLDFSDVYKKGFAFDKVKAKFKLENGDAISDVIKVKAAAANIKMFGRIGMYKRDYDLDVLVKPHSKGASFTGGTLVGGPILGAGLVILQNLFNLDELTQDKYKITGSWDSPKMTLVSKAKEKNKDDEIDEDLFAE